MRKKYFPLDPSAPPPLRATVARRVRFEEADPLGIVWHGRYASYFEDARESLGNSLGIGYVDFFAKGYSIPLRHLSVDFLSPLIYPEEFTVEAILHWTEAMRLNYEFVLRGPDQDIRATGCTIHLLVDSKLSLQMTMPIFYRDFLDCWRAGTLFRS
ncbi:acyl-CoA thioesterase [Desulfovibrio aerotolerans]|uniref:Acyl-CoA thioesterase n=1 Tax=Solidesulfovibrio aerotolerans TaxID=295255 RepID=A0A7C9INJ2_9BACT|nr:acyl-CoA thioesterase [Solidesulfovibrio aerotolerans]MYL84804.1 acyl-CoA thioesterase [Solidesulfovibrio aerotolerans]